MKAAMHRRTPKGKEYKGKLRWGTPVSKACDIKTDRESV